MPRAKKAGSGVSRSALAAAPSQSTTQPVVAPVGMPYGNAGALQAAQRQMPLPNVPAAPQSAPAGQASPPAPPGGGPDVLAAAQDMPPGPANLLAPSARPHEPVTAGQWSGPGAGPEARAPMPGGGAPPSNVQGLLQSMASQPGASPDLAYLAGFVQNGKA